MKQISVIGAGFVGLTVAACLADQGHSVSCGEANSFRLHQLINGEIPFYEADLLDLVRNGCSSGRLWFTGKNSDAIQNSDCVFVCVPTPSDDNGNADLTFVRRVIDDVKTFAKPGTIIVMKSTVPVGSGIQFESELQPLGLFYVSNPEFLREGTSVHDFRHPDRVVLGSTTSQAMLTVQELYRHIRVPVVKTDPTSAELIKYASNAFLATKISFINEFASLCELLGSNIEDVSLGLGLDHRVGPSFLKAGPGWGGSCFPKDTRALINLANEKQFRLRIVDAAVQANDLQIKRVAAKARMFCAHEDSKVGIFGLSFKAGTDDIRDSPAVHIASMLCRGGIKVVGYDPVVNQVPELEVDTTFTMATSALEAADGCDLILVLTEWAEFSTLDPNEVGAKMRTRQILDCRNVLDRQAWETAHFKYWKIGI